MHRAPRPHEQARADFSPPAGGQEWFQMVMQSMMKQYHRDFVHKAQSDRFSPCVTAVPHRRRTSEHLGQLPVEHEGESSVKHLLSASNHEETAASRAICIDNFGHM